MRMLLLLLCAAALAPISLVAGDDYPIFQGLPVFYANLTLANDTTVTVPDSGFMLYCSVGDLTLPTQDKPTALFVYGSTVRPGSLVRAFFGATQFSLVFRYTIFERDARFVASGALQYGTYISFEHCSFDVRTSRGGDTVAIDLRGILTLRTYSGLQIDSSTISLKANNDGGSSSGLIAAVASTIEAAVGGGLIPTFSFTYNEVTLNVTGVAAFGLFLSIKSANSSEVSVVGNRVRRVGEMWATAKVTAFRVDLPWTAGAILKLSITRNKMDRVDTFVELVGCVLNTDISYNVHSHHGPILSNVSVGTCYPQPGFQFRQNAFRTFYEPWNPASTLGNPTLIFAIPGLFPGTSFPVTHNEIVASRFDSIPILFPGTTDLANGSTVNVFGNYFASSVVPDGSLPMTSFAIGPRFPSRTVDLGVVYICSNTWPAAYVPSTTTTPVSSTTAAAQTSQSDAPTTWATVPSVDTLSVLVSPIDRPANVSIAGGGCPSVFVTRVANLASAQAPPFLGLVLVMLASLLFSTLH